MFNVRMMNFKIVPKFLGHPLDIYIYIYMHIMHRSIRQGSSEKIILQERPLRDFSGDCNARYI